MCVLVEKKRKTPCIARLRYFEAELNKTGWLLSKLSAYNSWEAARVFVEPGDFQALPSGTDGMIWGEAEKFVVLMGTLGEVDAGADRAALWKT